MYWIPKVKLQTRMGTCYYLKKYRAKMTNCGRRKNKYLWYSMGNSNEVASFFYFSEVKLYSFY